MKFTITRFGFIALLAATLNLSLLTGTWAHDDDDDDDRDDIDVERMFVFGDSLSDTGNVFAATGGAVSIPPYLPIPNAPYPIRGVQFSNGPTWAKIFARKLELRRSGKAALFRPGVFGNYAFGGARANPGDPSIPSGPVQVLLYLQDYGGQADAQALYVIQLGGNDLRDALDALLTNPNPEIGAMMAYEIIQSAVEAEAGMIQQLHQQGARNFLVANVPNLGRTPIVRSFGPQAQAAAALLTGAYNAGLETAVTNLGALPDVSIDQLDFFGILEDIAEHPREFGIRNTADPCLTFFVIADAVCAKPHKYLFWDAIHPTARVHRIVGRQAAEIYDD